MPDVKTETQESTAPWWRCLHCGCDEYEEHVFTGHMKGVPMIHCANCEALHSPPDPNSKAALRWQISELAEALERLLELQDFHDDRAHWESEHRLGNGAAWRVLCAMDALAAQVDRSPKGQDPAEGLGRNDESAVPEGNAPRPKDEGVPVDAQP